MSVAWLWVWVRPHEERAKPARAWPSDSRPLADSPCKRAGMRSVSSLGRCCYPGLAARLDVLVDPEEVLGVPLVLQLHEPRVLLGAVARAHPLLPLVGLEVQVHAPGSEGAHRFGEPPDPVDVPLSVRRVLPGCYGVGHVRRVAVTSGVASSGTRLTAPPWRKMIIWVVGLEIRAISVAYST